MSSNVLTSRASFTRPSDTTAYTAADLVANSTTAGSVAPMEWAVGPLATGFHVIRARLHKTTATTTAATFALHLFQSEPTVSNGDNGAFVPTVVTDWCGSLAIDMSSGALAGAAGLVKMSTPPTSGMGPVIKMPTVTSRLYGLLVATAGYAPGSDEVFTITLEMGN